MNRRTFLKLGAGASAWFSMMSMGLVTKIKAQISATPYGVGVYGSSTYSGILSEEPAPLNGDFEPQPLSPTNSDEKVYLPIVTR